MFWTLMLVACDLAPLTTNTADTADTADTAAPTPPPQPVGACLSAGGALTELWSLDLGAPIVGLEAGPGGDALALGEDGRLTRVTGADAAGEDLGAPLASGSWLDRTGEALLLLDSTGDGLVGADPDHLGVLDMWANGGDVAVSSDGRQVASTFVICGISTQVDDVVADAPVEWPIGGYSLGLEYTTEGTLLSVEPGSTALQLVERDTDLSALQTWDLGLPLAWTLPRLATNGDSVAVSSLSETRTDRVLTRLDLEDGATWTVTLPETDVFAVAADPDGAWALTTTGALIYSDGTSVLEALVDPAAQQLTVAEDGSWLMTGGSDGRVRVYTCGG